MPRYAAFLRGVSPTNLSMPDLKRALEAAGFAEVKTLLSSGNAVFTARAGAIQSIQRKVEQAMSDALGKTFMTIVRPVEELRALIERDPFRRFKLGPDAKRVVTFLLAPPAARIKLPPERDGARILAVEGGEAFSCYRRGPSGPVFMVLIEKTFGKQVTTRTWDTVRKAAR